MLSATRNVHVKLTYLDGFFAFASALACVIYANSSRIGPEAWTHFLGIRITVYNAAFALLFMFIWTSLFKLLGLYRPEERFVGYNILRLVVACLAMAFVLACYLTAAHTVGPTAKICIDFFIFSLCCEISRVIIRQWQVRRNPLLVIILGSGRRATKAWRELRTRFHRSITLVGFVDDRPTTEMAPDIAARYLGRIEELDNLLLHNFVDELLIALPTRSCYDDAQRAIAIAEKIGVRSIYMHDMYNSRVKSNSGIDTALFNDLVPLHADYIAHQELKRLFDIVCAFTGLILLMPIFLCIAAAVKLTSPGPVFFVQDRYGYRRRLFKIYKFRTMVRNAAELMNDLEKANEATGPIFKIRNDPRVTPLGYFLRATSLDELPQLWNVLIGNMSLVGPRPMSIRDVSRFNEGTLMRRFTVRPGVTGLWQVNGRHILNFDKWVEMDCSYIDGWSLSLDFEILAKTLPVVFRKTGA
ncbi:MAG TPA: sugar transferase [Candidatus Acidoferrales bacterium]|jgi:exopolysaccharide biosynthesis polyprenyl glycosylphosphotransferase|nr:sugar transferase [Candidatus Acidoferrales bacterium]